MADRKLVCTEFIPTDDLKQSSDRAIYIDFFRNGDRRFSIYQDRLLRQTLRYIQ